MKKYTYPDTQALSSVKNELVVGQLYDYKEGSLIGECQFVSDESNDKFFVWKFRWTLHPFNPKEDGTEFEVSWTKELPYKDWYVSGNVQILPKNSYNFSRRPLVRM